MQITEFKIFSGTLSEIESGKKLITTINAHSYNVSKTDGVFAQALKNSDILIPDGISIVWAFKWLKGETLSKIAGADLFDYEMNRMQKKGGKCFFLGSTEETLQKIKERASYEYPAIEVYTYSPPYRVEFSDSDSELMIKAINDVKPDVLFIGLTAPKQEKWAYKFYDQLHVEHICCVGAVFDFYAGTVNRAPYWMIDSGLEWFYRLVKEPKRMWRRYLLGNLKFGWYLILEKFK